VPYEATLEEIDGLAGRGMTSALDRMRMHLDERRYDALHDYLVRHRLEMAATYDPEVGQAFSTYFFRRARRRVIDWIRRTHGDKRYGNELKLPLNFPESLSTITDHDHASTRVAIEDPEPDSLADAIVELGRDLSTDARWALVNVAGRMAEGATEHTALRESLKWGWLRRGEAELELLREELAL
jgi:hypothetical protein